MSFSYVVTSPIDTVPATVGTLRWALGRSIYPTIGITEGLTITLIEPLTINRNVMIGVSTGEEEEEEEEFVAERFGLLAVANPPVITSDPFFDAGNSLLTINEGYTVTIEDITFVGNPGSLESTGIYLLPTAALTLTRCVISGMRAEFGAGIYSTDATVIVDETVITSNQVANGGIYCSGGTLTVLNSQITNNTYYGNPAGTTANGGGISVLNGTATITFTTIANNTAFASSFSILTMGGGGGLRLMGSTGTVDNTTISGNRVLDQSGLVRGGGGGIGAMNSVLSMTNSTIGNNISNITGGGIFFGVYTGVPPPNPPSLTLLGVTISRNRSNATPAGAPSSGGIYLSPTAPIPIIRNSLIALNTDSATATPSDINGTVDTQSSYNFIGINNDNNFVNGVDNNIVGMGVVEDPLLDPLGDNGGPTETFSLRAGSPATNAANPDFFDGIIYDQRGAPFFRVVDGLASVGGFEYRNALICFHGDSLVYTRDIHTQKCEYIQARGVTSDRYEVFDTQTEEFVPIIHNIVTGLAQEIIHIPKNLLGDAQPFEDFYITAGHPILIDGKEVYSNTIEGADVVAIEPSWVYSICTDIRRAILINGLHVMTWNPDDWYETCKQHDIPWSDNKIEKANK